MAGYTTMNAFFDESGKFKDHKIISFGGVADYGEQFVPFAREWGQLLTKNGLKDLKASTVFNIAKPLSERNKSTGIRKRIQDLLPFVSCIRKHLQVVAGITVDADAYKKMPSHFFSTYDTDPSFMAFARTMLHLVEYTPPGDRISFVCDEDEATALPFYRLYRRVKKVWPKARNRMAGISFADDKYLFALQAADLVAGLMRLESGRLWLNTRYRYRPLFKALTKNPERHERLWAVDIAYGDKTTLLHILNGLEKARKEAVVT
jgi:Protein of unknown function (DUF3800)